jgi:tRNA(Ile)-lysidine synthase
MQDQLRRAIQQHQLISSGDILIVGVSGGTDSLALMHALAAQQKLLDFTLHVATLDHGWRGEQSAADAQFVVDTAISLRLPITVGAIDVNNRLQAPNEASARQARYDFFARVAHDIGADRVATAHHAHDQAETVLMNLIRGTGLQGIAGMRWASPMPYHPSIPLIRPLLGVTRQQIEEYCVAHDLSPRYDPTNSDIRFLRNRVRLDILPQLAEINPNIYESLTRLADTAAVDADYLQQTVDILSESQQIVVTKNNYRIHRSLFKSQHIAIRRRLLIQAVKHLTPSADLDYQHITAGVRIAIQGAQGAIAEFPGDVRLRVDYGWLNIERAAQPFAEKLEIALKPGTIVPLQVETLTPVIGGVLCLTTAPQKGWYILGIGYPSFHSTFQLRTRQPGDAIALPGMDGHTQTLKKWMINRKIPASVRDRIPIIETSGEVFAIVHPELGVIAHPYHEPEDNRSQALSLTWQPFDNT